MIELLLLALTGAAWLTAEVAEISGWLLLIPAAALLALIVIGRRTLRQERIPAVSV